MDYTNDPLHDESEVERGFAALMAEYQQEIRPIIRKQARTSFIFGALITVLNISVATFDLLPPHKPSAIVAGCALLGVSVLTGVTACSAYRRWRRS